MSRKRRSVGPGHGTPRERAEARAAEEFGSRLRFLQLGSAAVMLVGFATCLMTWASENKSLWPVALGAGVFAFGLLLFSCCRPVARWWCRRG
jgi:hypothetical protein